MVHYRSWPRQASQARVAWLKKDEYEQAKALTILEEQEEEHKIRRGEAPHPNDIEDEEERKKHEPSPRLVKMWTKEPRANRRRLDYRKSLRVLVPCTQVRSRTKNKQTGQYEYKNLPGRWYLPGLGQIALLSQDDIPSGANIRSCHLVEQTRPGTPAEKRRYVLKVQCGHEVPVTKEGIEVGIDYGIRKTVTTSEGTVLKRPDTSALQKKAEQLRAHAKGRCKKGAHRYRELYAKARKLSQKIARISSQPRWRIEPCD